MPTYSPHPYLLPSQFWVFTSISSGSCPQGNTLCWSTGEGMEAQKGLGLVPHLPELFILQQDTWPTAWLPLAPEVPVAKAADVHEAEGELGTRRSRVKAQMGMGW